MQIGRKFDIPRTRSFPSGAGKKQGLKYEYA